MQLPGIEVMLDLHTNATEHCFVEALRRFDEPLFRESLPRPGQVLVLICHFIFEFPLLDGVSQPEGLCPWRWDGPFGSTTALARPCQSRSGPEGAIGRKTSLRWTCFYAGLRLPSTGRERTAESDSSARCVTGACCIGKSLQG